MLRLLVSDSKLLGLYLKRLVVDHLLLDNAPLHIYLLCPVDPRCLYFYYLDLVAHYIPAFHFLFLSHSSSVFKPCGAPFLVALTCLVMKFRYLSLDYR